MNNVKKNCKTLLYIESIFSLEIFFATIMIPFYRYQVGINFYEISLFFSVILIFNWLLEIPGGLLSDQFGRKKAFIIGKTFYLSALIGLMFAHSIYSLLLLALLFSLGVTIGSGNLSAIIYESLANVGEEKSYLPLANKSKTLAFTSAAVACVAGGYLGDIDLRLPLVVDACFLLLTIFLGLWLLERLPEMSKPKEKIKPNIRNIAVSAVQILQKERQLLVYMLFSAICFGVIRAVFNFYQPAFESHEFNLGDFGLILGFLNLVAALSTRLYARDPQGDSYMSKVGAAFLLSALLCLFFGQHAFVLLLVIVIQQIIRGTYEQFSRANINHLMPKEFESRTTVLSVLNMLRAMLASLCLLLSGFLGDYFGWQISIVTLSLFASFMAITLAVTKRQNVFVARESVRGVH